MARALLRTFVARGIAALGSLALVIVLGRLYGSAGVGVFAIAQSALLAASILARYGMNSSLMRFVGRSPQSRQVMTYLRWACTKALCFGLIAGSGIYFSRGLLERVFGAEDLSPILVGVATATPAVALSFLLSGFMKGIRRPATACLLEYGSIALVTSVIILASHYLRLGNNIASAGWALALAAWLVLAQGAWQLSRWHSTQDWVEHRGISRPCKEEFAKSSRAFFVMSLATLIQSVMAIMIAGLFLSSADLGLFKAAQQTSVLIGFVLLVINAVLPPRFAKLFHEGQYRTLERLARYGALFGMGLAMIPFLICLLLPEMLLSLFGSDFSGAANLLRIIAIAQIIGVTTGSVGLLLAMSGHESLVRNIALFSGAVGLSSFFVLVPTLGVLGAALALALVICLQNLAAVFYVWRCMGIWTLPLPNVLKLVLAKHNIV